MLDLQALSVLDEAAYTDAQTFVAEFGHGHAIGDWDAEAFAVFRQAHAGFLESSGEWDAAWECYAERLAMYSAQTPAQFRRAISCPTCAAAGGAACPGTRDHNSRYRAAGQEPPPSGRRVAGMPAGYHLADDSILADLSFALVQRSAGVALSYPERCDTPTRRLEFLLGEVGALLRSVTAPPERS